MLIQQAVRLPNGIILNSVHVHDFIEWQDAEGNEVFMDGGTHYCRRTENFPGIGCTDLTIDADEPFDAICDKLVWGTMGKDGKGPMKWVLVKDMELDHLNAVTASFQAQLSPIRERVIGAFIIDKLAQRLNLSVTVEEANK